MATSTSTRVSTRPSTQHHAASSSGSGGGGAMMAFVERERAAHRASVAAIGPPPSHSLPSIPPPGATANGRPTSPEAGPSGHRPVTPKRRARESDAGRPALRNRPSQTNLSPGPECASDYSCCTTDAVQTRPRQSHWSRRRGPTATSVRRRRSRRSHRRADASVRSRRAIARRAARRRLCQQRRPSRPFPTPSSRPRPRPPRQPPRPARPRHRPSSC